MYESSGSEFFRTTTGIQPGPNTFDDLFNHLGSYANITPLWKYYAVSDQFQKGKQVIVSKGVPVPPLNPACPSPYKNLFPLPSFFFPGLETWQVFRETIYCYHVCALCGNDEGNFVSLRYWQKHYVNNSNQENYKILICLILKFW